MQSQLHIKRAIISVSNKFGVVEFALNLHKNGIEILATGGTAKLLQESNIPSTEISDYTGFPEIMGGRVKTLHPKIAGGILGRRGTDDAVMAEHGINPIDLVVVNLYPFAKTIENKNASLQDAIEQIDIGGPTLLRAAAKNFESVTTVVDPNDYDLVLEEMATHSKTTTKATRLRLAQKVFTHTGQYDCMIANYLSTHTNQDQTEFPTDYQPHFIRKDVLRYGENPHQKAALYHEAHPQPGTLANANLLQGKPLSYNNMIDADCALQTVQELRQNFSACVIVKHATPCGGGEAQDPLSAYTKAYRSDPQSAFGGVIAFNQTVDALTAQQIISQQFVEVLIAPHFEKDALNVLQAKQNLRVLAFGEKTTANTNKQFALHSISGGLLAQQRDTKIVSPEELTIATDRAPTDSELRDLIFAWQIVKFTKSNAIVYAKDQATLGIGTGQTSRVFAAQIAAKRAKAENLNLKQAVMASDAFFPFADSIEYAASLGISAIIQPGGSKRDPEVIACANAHNIAMVFTQTRHFRH